MTTLIVNIPDSDDARKIADVLDLMDGVADIRIEEKKMSFEQACAECNAVPAEEFFAEVRSRIKERYRNA